MRSRTITWDMRPCIVVAVIAACLNGLVLGDKVLRVAVIFNIPDVVQSKAWDVFKEHYNDRPVNGDKLVINDTKYFVWPSYAAAEAESWRNSSRWQTKLEYIAFSRDDQNRSVEPYHLLVHPMAESDGISIGSKLMQAASIPNVHAGCADESDFKASNDYTFGTSLPDIWFPRDPIRLAKVRGLGSMLVVVTRWVSNFRRIAHAALGWALKEDLSTIGPSSQWCHRWANTTESCRIVSTTCHCGMDSMMPKDLPYSVTQIETFYEFNEFNCGYTPDSVDSCTVRYVGHIIKDAFAQGSEPDIFFDWTVVFRDVLYGVFLASYNPKMYGGYLQDGTPNWATVDTGLVNSTHGWWALVTGQWHRAMRFTDLTFGSSWEALRLLNPRLSEQEQNNTRAVEVLAVGSVLNVAIEKHMDEEQFDGQPLQSQRNAIRSAMTDLNDETLWGHVRFNRNNQNIGRGLASWQIVPDITVVPYLPQDKCVLPSEFAEIEAVIPAPTWESRFGCPAGTRNAGAKCEQCEIGRSKSTRGTGVVISECSLCERGRGASGTGLSVCMACEPGRKHDGTLGYCVDCERGSYISTWGSTSCRFCPPGKFQNGTNPTACSDCIAGTYRGSIDDGCRECRTGAFGAKAGQEECEPCGIGSYADEKARTECTSCDGVLAGSTTQLLSADKASFCVCPEGQYKSAERDVCLQCPSKMTCALGAREEDFALNGTESSNFPLVNEGYYTESDNPLKVYMCRPLDACSGTFPASCANGRVGFLCARCPDGEAIQAGRCVHSRSRGTVVLVALPILAPILALCVYYKSNGPIYADTSSTLGAGVMVGLTVTTVQVVGTMAEVPLRWSGGFVEGSMSASQVFLFDPDSLSLEAVLGFDPTMRYAIRVLVPYAVPVLFLSMYFVSQLFGAISRNATCWSVTKVLNSIGTVFQAVFIAIVGVVAVPYQCYSHPSDNGASVSQYPNVICWDKDHELMLALSSMLLATLVLPFAVASLCGTCQAHRVSDVQKLARFRFLLYRFRPDVWWWGNIFILRQALLAFCPMTRPDDPEFQFIFVAMILEVYSCVLFAYFPWRTIEPTILDGTCCLLLLLLIMVVSAPTPAISADVVVLLMVLLLMTGLMYALANIAIKGRLGQFGMSYPRNKSLSTFAQEWRALSEICAKLDLEVFTYMLASMSYFDRYALDVSMTILQDSSAGSIRVSDHCMARLQGLPRSSSRLGISHDRASIGSEVSGSVAMSRTPSVFAAASSDGPLETLEKPASSSAEGGNVEPGSIFI